MDKKLLGIFDLISHSIDLFTKNLGAFATIATPAVAANAIFLVLAYLADNNIGGKSVYIILPFSLVLWLFVGFVAMAALFRQARAAKQGTIISAESAYQQSAKKFFSYFWVAVLASLVSGLSSFALIIPGVILSVYISFSLVLAVTEDKKGFDALVESVHLIKGRWWKVFGRLLGFSLFALIIGLISGVILQILVGDYEALSSVLSSAVGLYIITPLSALLNIHLVDELRKDLQPVTPLDAANYRRNILAVTGVGLLACMAFVYFIYSVIVNKII